VVDGGRQRLLRGVKGSKVWQGKARENAARKSRLLRRRDQGENRQRKTQPGTARTLNNRNVEKKGYGKKSKEGRLRL